MANLGGFCAAMSIILPFAVILTIYLWQRYKDDRVDEGLTLQHRSMKSRLVSGDASVLDTVYFVLLYSRLRAGLLPAILSRHIVHIKNRSRTRS